MEKIRVFEYIREYRRKNSLSQAQLGALLGVSPQAVSKWERGESYPDITILPVLADKIGCSVGDFFGKED